MVSTDREGFENVLLDQAACRLLYLSPLRNHDFKFRSKAGRLQNVM